MYHMKQKVLITGGAGYIGSHCVKRLGELGYEILTIDNLSNGNKNMVLYGLFRAIDISDLVELKRIISDFKPDVVIHFAASIYVDESLHDPIKYYKNNTENTLNLLKILIENQVKNFVFSSTAAVYGNPKIVPLTEDSVLDPINPYGKSKMFAEMIIEDISKTHDINYIILRYFNVAGADPDGKIGQICKNPTHLITRAIKCAKGQLPYIEIYGTDYPTPDGTCIRDYIHVMDVVDAHVLAMQWLFDGGKNGIFNCGYGYGYSVRDVIDFVKRVTGNDFIVKESSGREGDPYQLIADCRKIKSVLNWKPQYDDLEFIIRTAWNWEQYLDAT